MPNERLRATMLERGVTPADLAALLDVDPKTVERWITKDRPPYRRHQYAAAKHLGVDVTFLWPDSRSAKERADVSEGEIVKVYPHRWGVPRDAWRALFASAEHEIGILAYSAMFLADDLGLLKVLKEKAGQEIRVRILFGDPESLSVAQRGADEGIDDVMAAKIRNSIVVFQQTIKDTENIEVRLHDTVLYNSIYFADDHMLVNCHIYGTPAANAPVMHLRKITGGDMATTYLDSFERVWREARPVQ